ncbi:hydroxymethylglutaryl-CoA reductase [Carboxylicivirga sp. N1Y90]|uniref:hydroxymethylglutaryl-CoA reductase n=1 Tax=Carboxylicivirga fragile TaxID=3417571 RepID=UPI003D32EB3D|nr:hydroxymethylglutaryl-CoA reductase [Marinilabiliaceae bacterium N1Y90]
MDKKETIRGFSRMSREEKIQHVIEHVGLSEDLKQDLDRYLHPSEQTLFNNISENTVSNYYLPYSLAPNFLINDTMYIIPMVIEESSVVAAASKAASFWAKNGGFKTRIINVEKNGQIFFSWAGTVDDLKPYSKELEILINKVTESATANMRSRGGGITSFEIKSIDNMPNTHQLLVKFKTGDSMGANFINTCLEIISPELIHFINSKDELKRHGNAKSIMSILSNYTPNCLVECQVSCPIEQLKPYAGEFSTQEFAQRFKQAVDIAINDPYRATTHNKGIFNGIDAVVLATGNDFRAIEAGAQAYASHNGQYSSLTKLELSATEFTYTLEVPLALGTVGGLTNVHPMVKASLEILNQPSAEQLMQITAAAGLANNFGAVAALVTTGIQKGHMKLHLSNILTSMNTTDEEREKANEYFKNETVSYSGVENFLKSLRN